MADIVDPFDTTTTTSSATPAPAIVDPFDKSSGINIRPGGVPPPPKPDFSWGQAVTDIWPEIKKEASTALSSMVPEVTSNPLTNLANTGKAVLAVPQLLASPLTGTARSLMGHTAANLVHKAGEATFPSIAAKDDPAKMYEEAKHDTDLAMMTLGPEAGGINKVPVVPKAPAPPPSVAPVVAAADRISQVAPAPINVPKAFASDSIAVQRAGQLARNIPFVGDRIPRATGEMADQLGNAAGSIANEYGQGSGPNVANRIGTTIHNAAEAETNAATNAARTSDEALLADWQRYQDATHANINNQENTALTQARAATGDMSLQDMGQALIDRLRAGEQAARAEKDRLYNVAGNTDASVQASAVQGLHDQVSNALYDAGRVVDPQLTPAANSMMNELRNFSNLQIPNRVGPRPPAPEDIVSVSAQGIEQTRKRLGNMAQAATNDADRAASRITMNQFDNWQTAAYDNALYSGSPQALDAIRGARAANTSWRQRFYNDRDDADRLINRVVTGEVTPQEMSNWLVGTSQIGAKGVSSRLLTRLNEATANDPAAMDTIRAGVANRLFGTTPGAAARTPEKIASDINEFFNGSGRDAARRLYTPQQRQAALDYASTLRRSQEARQNLAEVARNTKPSAMPVNPGPMQELATSILGKNGKTDEALFSAIDAYAKSGSRGDIKTLSDIMNNIPAQDRGDLAGAIIRQLGHSTQTKGFALDKFVTEWNKYTPQAKTILFGNAGPHRQALDDIATIAQRYKEVGRRFGNPSGTGQTAIGAGLLSALYFHPFTTIPALVGGAVFARMLAAPASAVKTAGLLKNAWLATKSANPLRLATLNASLVNFVKEANRFGANVSLQNVQGPGTSNAKEPTPPAPENPFKRGGKVKGYATDGSVDDTPSDAPDDTIDPREQRISIRPAAPASDDLVQAAIARLATPPPISSIPDERPDFIKSLADAPFSEGNPSVNKVVNKLTSDQPGDPRFQTWPERIVRSGASLAHDVYTGEQPMLKPGLRREDFTDVPPPDQPTEDSTWLGKTLGVPPVAADPSDPVIQRTQDMAAVGGLGALAGIEEGAAGVFGGKLSKIADHDAMAKAEQMEASGANPDQIWNQTKTARGADGQWRQEIDDSQSKLKIAPSELTDDLYLDDVLHHPELYKAYPNLKDTSIQPLPSDAALAGVKGRYFPSTDTIQLGRHLSPDEARSTLLHEIQHAVQNKEGFAPGDNPSNHIPAALIPARQQFEAVRADTQADIEKSLGTNDLGVEYMKDLIRREKYGPDAAQQDIPAPYVKTFQDILAKNPDAAHRLGNIVESEKLLADADQKAYTKYKSAMGEVESRNVQDRLAYPQFKRSLPEYTEDTPRNQQVDGTSNAGTEQASGPYFRPAMKYQGKIYKAPIGSDEHMDAVPDSIYPELQQKAMTGQDISDYNFGYMNNKGQFMSREGALDYGIKEGLIDPQAGQFGHLSTPVLKQYALYSDSSEAGAPLAALEKTQPFYSQVEKTIQSAPQQKMQGSQWANWLKNQPGVKPDEMQYTGIEDWLRGQKGPVTKQAVQDYIGSNKVQVGDKVSGDSPNLQKLMELDKRARLLESEGEVDEARAIRNQIKNLPSNPNFKPKWSEYQLPGGENYREHLITLQGKKASPADISDLAKTLYETYDRKGGEPLFKDLPIAKQQEYLNKAEEKSYLADNPNAYRSSHWDEPNVVAHARTTDRTFQTPFTDEESAAIEMRKAAEPKLEAYRQQQANIAKEIRDKSNDLHHARVMGIVEQVKSGKLSPIEGNRAIEQYESPPELKPLQNKLQVLRTQEDALRQSLPLQPQPKPIKALHIEEAQSDWAQAGRKNGFKDQVVENKRAQLLQQRQSLIDKYGKDAFDQSALDRFPDDPIAARELKKYWDDKQGVWGYNAYAVPDMPFKQTEQWAGLVMKRMIQKAIDEGKTRVSWTPGEAQPTNPKNLGQTGEEAERADKGNQKFYNEILPNVVQKLGKKYGVQVKDGEIPLKDYKFGDLPGGYTRQMWDQMSPSDRVKALNEDKQSVKYFDIPPKMREDVSKNGFQLFSDTSKSAPLSALENAKFVGKRLPAVHNPITGRLQVASQQKLKDVFVAGGPPVEALPKTPLRGKSGQFSTIADYYRNRVPTEAEKTTLQTNPMYDPANPPAPVISRLETPKANNPADVERNLAKIPNSFSHVHTYKHKDNIGRIVQEGETKSEVEPPHRAHGGRVLASNINHNPSESQKRSGAYAKDRIHIHGLKITIENAKGSTRTGVSSDGKSWSSILPSHYGYINRTEGADQDHLDVYLGPHIKSEKVYVINQVDHNTKSWDEHKIMLGFGSLQQALNTYEKAFSDGKGLLRVGSIVATTMPEFKKWLKEGNTKKPYIELRKEVA